MPDFNPKLYSTTLSKEREAITPADSTFFSKPARGFTVGGEGDVALIDEHDTVVVLPARQVGIDYYHQCWGIAATGTTATGIIIFY